MPDKPPPKDSATLGDSWVVASKILDKADVPKTAAPQPESEPEHDKHAAASESLATSSSSISGPELVMPSIYEVPVSEKSWVAPNMRTGRDETVCKPRQRHKPRSREPRDGDGSTTTNEPQGPVSKGKKEKRNGILMRLLKSTTINRPVRTILNSIIVVGILHLLILPELVYQCQSLCGISTFSRFYAHSCVTVTPLPLQSEGQMHSTETTKQARVQKTQIQLETLFNTTLAEISPHRNTLRQSDTKLHSAQTELKKIYPGRKNELDLEFSGCWIVLRGGVRKLDTLVADMHSAVDSLVAAGGLQLDNPGQKQGMGWTHRGGGGMARDARVSTQLQRRKQYLDAMGERMRTKAEGVSGDLATLDEHLESIGDIVERERRLGLGMGSDSGSEFLLSFISELQEMVVAFFQAADQKTEMVSHEESVVRSFHSVASHHRPVTEIVRNLSSRLATLHTARIGP